MVEGSEQKMVAVTRTILGAGNVPLMEEENRRVGPVKNFQAVAVAVDGSCVSSVAIFGVIELVLGAEDM